MVITNYFDITINNNNVKHYNKKGYKCNSGDIIPVFWEDVPSYTDIECLCDKCNEKYNSKKSTLLTQKHKGLCKSCSCQINEYNNVKDITGKIFNKLTVIKLHKNIHGGEKYWECLCDCGNTKIASGRSLKTGKTTSCGCYRKEVIQNIIIPKLIEKNKKQTGKNHPNWDSTKSNKERFTIRKHEMSILREQTFKRDNHTCQCCFQRGSKVLNAHHILPFSKHVELRYDLNNLITLCYDCHTTYHSKYKKNINQETLNQFKKEISFVI
jgi:hypothetical protein